MNLLGQKTKDWPLSRSIKVDVFKRICCIEKYWICGSNSVYLIPEPQLFILKDFLGRLETYVYMTIIEDIFTTSENDI